MTQAVPRSPLEPLPAESRRKQRGRALAAVVTIPYRVRLRRAAEAAHPLHEVA